MPNLPISKLLAVIDFQPTDQLAIVSQRNGVPTTQKIPVNQLAEIVPVSIKVSLTSPQILALNSTPIEAIPAPGANKAIHVIAAAGLMAFGGIGYASFVDAILTSTSRLGSSHQYILSSFFDLVSGGNTKLAARSDAGGVQITTNEALIIAADGGDPTAGNGTADLFITYVILNV